MQEIVLATRNKKKLVELRQILEALPLQLRTLDDFQGIPEVEETGKTFEENARLKAISAVESTHCWVLADDSGLEVDALDGRPGIFSARYSGEHATDATNRQQLLEELAGTPNERRTARFVCVVVLASPDGESASFRGECEGRIIEKARGVHGFGYDPIFLIPEFGQTMAELSPEVKNRISHRGRALEKASQALKEALNGFLPGMS